MNRRIVPRHPQAIKAQEWLAKDEAAKAEIVALRNNKGARGYAYNHKGDIVYLTAPVPDQLPNYAGVNMHYHATEQAAPAALKAFKGAATNLMALPGLGAKLDKVRLRAMPCRTSRYPPLGGCAAFVCAYQIASYL